MSVEHVCGARPQTPQQRWQSTTAHRQRHPQRCHRGSRRRATRRTSAPSRCIRPTVWLVRQTRSDMPTRRSMVCRRPRAFSGKRPHRARLATELTLKRLRCARVGALFTGSVHSPRRSPLWSVPPPLLLRRSAPLIRAVPMLRGSMSPLRSVPPLWLLRLVPMLRSVPPSWPVQQLFSMSRLRAVETLTGSAPLWSVPPLWSSPPLRSVLTSVAQLRPMWSVALPHLRSLPLFWSVQLFRCHR
jgi:hypothetical protein